MLDCSQYEPTPDIYLLACNLEQLSVWSCPLIPSFSGILSEVDARSDVRGSQPVKLCALDASDLAENRSAH